ncbi:NAD(P)/FAD-dependent oxidoreductase [Chachezhania antarctica]|uniref:NAD(P)/FAD-dependent oxidoreductase n=1 Tax=Chachezhania antarctica TaxID=2340860 RepID=UPI000EB04BF4|nr:FAD-binding oxidoreductase [Chachezhania antarctica]|tara:strand:- start:3852 stop:4883 length:1032 start_codon:yes stop_codon:yes gene_type:complete
MVDVTVRGAGIFGLTVAWALLQRGARVQIVDPHGPGAGASGGHVGALAPHVPENWNDKKAFQLDSLLMAEGLWAGVREAGGTDPGYVRSGRLQPLTDDRAIDLARARIETARELWAPHAVWEVIPAPDGPMVPPSPTGLYVRDTLTARVSPRGAVAALVAALARKGIVVQAEAPDRGAVLWATGAAGLDMLTGETGKPVGMGIKGQSALLGFAAKDAPQVFADSLHIVPHADGTVAIGSTTERDYDDPATTDTQLDALIDKARALVPALADAPVIDRWAGLRPRAKSRAPMLGPWPGRPGHYIANGGFKIGFGMAPKVAECMADLLLEDRITYPAAFAVDASL